MTYILADEAWEHLSCQFINSTNMYWRPALCQTPNEALEIQCRIRQTRSSLHCADGLVGEERHWATIIKYHVPVWVGGCGILQGHARKVWLGLNYGVRVFSDCHLRHEGREVGIQGLSFVPSLPFSVQLLFPSFLISSCLKSEKGNWPKSHLKMWINESCSAEIIRGRQVDAKQVRKTNWQI